MRRYVPWAAFLVLALGFFIAGVFRPFTAVTKLWVFENQISVFQGLIVLWKASELFLFLILFVFTVSTAQFVTLLHAPLTSTQ